MTKEKLILKQFVEGKISCIEFWDIYNKNPKIAKILLKDKTQTFVSYFSPNIIRSHFNINDIFERYGLYQFIKSYFVRNKILCNFYNEDEEYMDLINKIQPKYIDIREQSFWDSVILSAPQTLSKAKKMAFLKDKVKTLFKYSSKPPIWIQSPEWVIENNIPLKFIKQIDKGECVEYHFYNEISKETKIIEQFY